MFHRRDFENGIIAVAASVTKVLIFCWRYTFFGFYRSRGSFESDPTPRRGVNRAQAASVHRTSEFFCSGRQPRDARVQLKGAPRQSCGGRTRGLPATLS